MPYVAKNKILHNGTWFSIGDEVTGLNDKDADRLLHMSAVSLIMPEVAGSSTENQGYDGKDDPLSLEEFSSLTADEQREELIFLGIEQPASNKEGRIQQYTDWLNEQVKTDVNSSIS
ncbi:hypothetical protein [Paenibacillus contaminans]|uniref:Uncharacterized protein n=1 Tax=Paenibacillus contaminans TaxID=450362 RepID=A0A329MFX9_9BACL|nr:hypothetical protein [Paenibacillus contaminans]RAV18825.1 hypothetical protein DQG23_24150 [Paenibacillus contaminans]